MYKRFSYKQICYKQHQADIGKKNHAKAKQNPEVELVLSENYLLSSSLFSSKNNKDILSRAGITSATVQ